MYSFLSQGEAWSQLGDGFIIQLGQLTALTFARFEGVVHPSPPKTRWYLARPGMDRALSGVVLWRNQIVSNVYVTRLRFPLAGRTFTAGFVDTVMTHPQHRQQGLARRLLERALAGLRSAGVEVAALYTHPDTLPFQIYTRMGFCPYRRSVIWTRKQQPPDSDCATSLATTSIAAPSDSRVLQALINRFNANKDGFVTVDEELWEWRKYQRAANMPATVVFARSNAEIVGTVTFCPAELITAQGPSRSMYLTDLGLQAGSHEGVFAALLRASPPASQRVTLAGENDQPLAELLTHCGFAPTPGETCLLHPLTAAADQALQDDGRFWYVLPESVAGV